jgi:hypothetical protein
VIPSSTLYPPATVEIPTVAGKVGGATQLPGTFLIGIAGNITWSGPELTEKDLIRFDGITYALT